MGRARADAANDNAADDPVAAAPLDDAVRALARRGRLQRYRAGALLIEEGDVGDTLYVVLTGRLRVYGSNAGDRREFTYGSYGPGEYVGEMGLDGGRRAASVMAMEPTLCAVIPRAALDAHLQAHPEFAYALLAKVIRRARAATLSAKQMALNDVYGRLRLQLESLATADADGRLRIAERPTHAALSEAVGCSREMVSRVMKDLERGGHVRVEPPRGLSWLKLPARW